MQGDDVAGLEESFLAGDGLGHGAGVDLLGAHEGVVGVDIHAEALGDAGHIASHVTEGEDTQLLALELGAALAVVEVADGIDEQTHDELSNGVAVLAGGVHGDDAAGGASLEVEVVVAGAGAHNDLQVLGVVDDLFGHLVGADDEGVGILDGLVEVVHVGIFLKEGKLVAVLLDNFLDTVNSHFGKRFLGSN